MTVTTNESEIKIVQQQELLGKLFTIYGDFDNPLFLAKDVARWIDYDLTSVNKLVSLVDEDEKVRKSIPTLGGKQVVWFLTEDGLYEVLMQSTKPIAKQFKKGAKEILKSIRRTGTYQANKKYKTKTTLHPLTKIKTSLLWIEGVSKILNLNAPSKLALLK